MDTASALWPILCGVLFVAAAILFLIAGASRRKLDAALKGAAAPDSANPDRMRQPGLFDRWTPNMALAVPERRWSYDQDYMIAFIQAIRPQRISTGAGAGPGIPALRYYAT